MQGPAQSRGVAAHDPDGLLPSGGLVVHLGDEREPRQRVLLSALEDGLLSVLLVDRKVLSSKLGRGVYDHVDLLKKVLEGTLVRELSLVERGGSLLVGGVELDALL